VAALLDTSAIAAALDPKDPWHASVRDALARERMAPRLPSAVLPEVAWLIAARHGHAAAARVMRQIADGSWPIEPLETADVGRAGELMAQYADLGLSFVDAAVVAVAERLGISRVYTLDRRDFRVVRPRHVTAFEVLP
jgi:predicted nucleic acid-binding protein